MIFVFVDLRGTIKTVEYYSLRGRAYIVLFASISLECITQHKKCCFFTLKQRTLIAPSTDFSLNNIIDRIGCTFGYLTDWISSEFVGFVCMCSELIGTAAGEQFPQGAAQRGD